ncbi:hypothetical protein [Candidatus Aalborgicola defluviihabitans]|uniref:hypothetical protein n=1 Tax=Candidatus Aalborgicola defluviihabitans TaxID=3386187 RepID=UPI00390A431F|nr:hypothetical protein [Burkholderiales bacterium]
MQWWSVGFHGKFIAVVLYSIYVNKPYRKLFSRDFCFQLMEHGPTSRAGFALDITLARSPELSVLMHFFKMFGRAIAFTLCACVISYMAAAFLNTTAYAWPLVERMPHPIVDAAGRVLLVVFWPLLPSGVHEQEEMLELLLVWVFSGLALLPIAALVISVWFTARRSRSSSNQTAEAQ